MVGIRWQMLPVLAGAAIALPFALSPLLRRRTGQTVWRARWWLALPGSVACVGLIATGPVTAWAFPVPVLPEPSGRFAVGARVVQWTDPHRPETATADPHDRRTVVIQLWYPAKKSTARAQRARYLGRTEREARTVSDALARYAGLPGFLVDGVSRAHTHSVFNAPVGSGSGRFPVVLFSPGLGGVRTQNTTWAEEVASHGYLVAALDHPYDSAAVVLADGRTINTKVASTGVAGVVVESSGDVRLVGESESADGQVAQGCHGTWSGAGAYAGGVLGVRGVPDVVDLVLDAPVAADAAGDLGCVGLLRGQVGHPVDAFQGDLAGGDDPSAAHDLDGLHRVWERDPGDRGGLDPRISSRPCVVARVLSRSGTSRHGRAFSHWCRVG